MKKYTMADIAKEAGVAKSTVSRYFNDGYVKEETKKKIQEVVERTGFEPSAAASNLKSKETRMIGVVVPTMTSPTTGRLLNSMDNAFRQAGYACLILTTDHHPEREISAIEYLRSMRVDGIVLVATNLSKKHQALQLTSKIPFLVMGQRFPSGTSIIYDDYQAGLQVGEYVRRMGHKDVTYIGVNEEDNAVGHERKRGIMEGLSHAASVYPVTMEETSFTYEQARETARSLLEKHVPDLFICATDSIAMACYKEVREKGLRVPEDVSIVGFGGYEITELLSPTMTSIRYENELAGRLCASTLIAMIHGEPVPTLQVVGYQFREGESVSDMREADQMIETSPLENSVDSNKSSI